MNIVKKLFPILLVAAFIAAILITRFWQLGQLPPGTHVDMPSFTLEAQSLVETGRDTWGVKWPTYFKAFGEYKAPGLIYAYIPFIYLFGHVNNLVSRLPSALAGILTLIVTYFILRLISPKMTKLIAFILVVVMAFSPWHFGTSRVYFETNGGLFFLVLGLYFIFRYLQRHSRTLSLYAASASIALAGYWYASFRYIGIALLLVVLILSFYTFRPKLSLFFKVTLIFLAFGAGWIQFTLSTQGLQRLKHYQGFTAFGEELIINEHRAFCYLSMDKDVQKSKLCYLFWNKPLLRAESVAKTHLRFMTPGFLFFEPGQEYGVDSAYGAFLWPLLVGYFAGLYYLVGQSASALKSLFARRKPNFESTSSVLIALFILLGFLPAALTEELARHRGVVGLYGVTLLILLGLYQLMCWIKSNLSKTASTLLYLGFIAIMVVLVVQSQLNYFFYFTRSNDVKWSADSDDLYDQVKILEKDYDRIIDNAYMGPLEAAFYALIPTADLQTAQRTDPDPDGWTYIRASGKYEMQRLGLEDLICAKVRTADSRRTLVIINHRAEYDAVASFVSTTWDKSGRMNSILDLDRVITFDAKRNIDWQKRCYISQH